MVVDGATQVSKREEFGSARLPAVRFLETSSVERYTCLRQCGLHSAYRFEQDSFEEFSG